MPTDWQAAYETYFHDVQRVFMLTYRPWSPLYHINLWGAMRDAYESGSKLLKNWTLPFDLFNAAREVYGMQAATGSHHVDAHKNLVIETGAADVAGLWFSVSPQRIESMGEEARTAARRALKEAAAQGRIKLRYAKRSA
jgi:hypothetical protein